MMNQKMILMHRAKAVFTKVLLFTLNGTRLLLNDTIAGSGIIHLCPCEKRKWSGVCCTAQLLTQETATGNFQFPKICTSSLLVPVCDLTGRGETGTCQPELFGPWQSSFPVLTYALMTAQWESGGTGPWCPHKRCVKAEGRSKGLYMEKHGSVGPAPRVLHLLVKGPFKSIFMSLGLFIFKMGIRSTNFKRLL